MADGFESGNRLLTGCTVQMESAKFGNDWLFQALRGNATASSFIFFPCNTKAQSLLWNIAVKGNWTSTTYNIWKVGKGCKYQSYVDTACHTSRAIEGNIFEGYLLGFQDTTCGTSLNMGQRGEQREQKKKCVCHVLNTVGWDTRHSNLVHTGLQLTVLRDRPPT